MEVKEKVIKEITVGTSLIKAEATILLVENRAPVWAFVELRFKDEGEKDIFIIRGYTIKTKVREEDSKQFLSLDAPAFRTRAGYMKSFVIANKNLWRMVEQEILGAVKGKIDTKGMESEDINPDDILDDLGA